MKAKLAAILIASFAILAIGCNKTEEEPTAAATPTTGTPAANAGTTPAKSQGSGTAEAMLGPGAAGADARVGTQAGGK